ncbi:MAG: acetolactate synthase small subunit [Opitutales bacterium]
MKNPHEQQPMYTVLELTVKNHPGTLSHVAGLFARRAFNLDGILCMPLPDPSRSRIWLRVRENKRLEQVVSQLEKLVDVEQVRRHPADHAVFRELESHFT